MAKACAWRHNLNWISTSDKWRVLLSLSVERFQRKKVWILPPNSSIVLLGQMWTEMTLSTLRKLCVLDGIFGTRAQGPTHLSTCAEEFVTSNRFSAVGPSSSLASCGHSTHCRQQTVEGLRPGLGADIRPSRCKRDAHSFLCIGFMVVSRFGSSLLSFVLSYDPYQA